MKRRCNLLKRIMASALACVIVLSLLPAAAFAEGPEGEGGNSTYVLEASSLEAFDKGAKNSGDTDKVADFFTLLWSSSSKVDGSKKKWEDGYSSEQRINFGGKATTSGNSIKITTDDEATIKLWWVEGGDDNRQMAVLDADGNAVAATSGEYVKNDPYTSELKVEQGGTYYIGGQTGNNYIFKVEVTTGKIEKAPRKAWDEVAAPEISSVGTDAGTMTVLVNAEVGYDAADKVTVAMKASDGAVIVEKSSAAETGEHSLEFTPAASGEYTFVPTAVREGEEPHEGQAYGPVVFVLPLTKPFIKSVWNVGGGKVNLEWEPVAEAEKYEVTVDGTDIKLETSDCEAVVEGLAVGETYNLKVVAVRGEDRSEAGEESFAVTAGAQTAWAFSAFGTGVDLKTNGFEGNANDGLVKVYSKSGKGKLVPASTDGVAFYYTKIDPKTTNFKLTATANVVNWTYSNGQEGFGLMAADSVAANGNNKDFWNNSYMASVTKVEYNWDGEKVSDSGAKISMRLGVGSQEKVGVTPDNINEASKLDDMSRFSSVMTTLDTSCASRGAGTYNIVGNYTNSPAPTGTIDELLTSFKLSIEKNNTGYFVSYTNPEGVTTTKKYYDPDALSHLDEEVYVGFYASRNAEVEFTDIDFVTSDPAQDPPAEERPLTYVTPNYYVASAKIANSTDHTMVYYGNADGTLTVKNANGDEIFNGAVSANRKEKIPAVLSAGKNTFTFTMTPDAGYKPSEFSAMSSYEPVTFGHTVDFSVNEAETVYVGPDGKADAAGTKEDPMSLAVALTKAVPGQTIYLLEGTYAMESGLVIERGMDGTEEKNINLFADPDAATRPVIDFCRKGSGMTLGGNYWHFKGFDVTGSKDGDKGLQISGNNNTIELMRTYKNGNTGLQISRFKGIDAYEDWPSNNLILNCTSTLNVDLGFEDADGFAAKLTIADGNVFDGCISSYNADDGWDLFAKVEHGPIGKVVIKNSVAYKNGYILDDSGNEVNAGNGNGFKMGGESITGYHTLINSVAFANKAKGIDSNSCPDIQVENSTSFDNELNNVAFYTNTAVNTDYSAHGIISYKKSNMVAENIKPVGTQDTAKIYGKDNYYLTDGSFQNSEGVQVQDDWFISLDVQKAIDGGITRYPDGTVNMNGFLVLTDKAPADAGARLPEYQETEPVEPETKEYNIIGGKDAVWTKGSGIDLLIISDMPLDAFTAVEIDGKTVSPLNYTVGKDMTQVTIKGSYLEKLGKGSHTVKLVAKDGVAGTTLTVKDGAGTMNISRLIRDARFIERVVKQTIKVATKILRRFR